MRDRRGTLSGVGLAKHTVARAGEDIHHYLLDRLNDALRRPGLFGGEIGLVLLGEAVAHCRGEEEAWQREIDALRARGAANAAGVSGAFSDILPGTGRHDDAVASVYAEVAHRLGWLHVDPTLSRWEYDEIRARIPATCARDRTFTEVLTEAGPPSVHCGSVNRRHPHTLVYLTDRAEHSPICFHFWNTDDPSGRWPASAEPALLAVRTGPGRFVDTFTFTPEGKVRCNS